MNESELRSKFPGFEPIKSPPTLSTINGIGVRVHGARDRDLESGVYVKTRAFCVFFVPLVFIDAYCVADADKGWYFLGKVPLSHGARTWNLAAAMLTVAFVGLGAWGAFLGSPEHVAKGRLRDGRQLVASGQTIQAVAPLSEVAAGGTASAPEAKAELKHLLDESLPKLPPTQANRLLHRLHDVPRNAKKGAFTDADEVARGRALALATRATDPKTALDVVELIAPMSKDEDFAPLREELLVAAIAADPADMKSLGALAALHEERGDLEKAEELLRPHAETLGATEGARVLGRIAAAKGETELSHALLSAYMQPRLKSLQQAQSRYEKTVAGAQNRALNDLKQGKADKSWYDSYNRMGDAEQERAVGAWIGQRLKEDKGVSAAEAQLVETAAVVPAALDLGIVTLQRAQGLKDPKERKAELESAEKTFLSIRSLAGDSEAYRLYFGQVCYWLGKPDEGRQQFDELLEASKRSVETLLSVASALREVGADADARKLAEEAFEAAKGDDEKHAAASMRALLAIEPDDKILWLGRSDTKTPFIAASLDEAKAQKAHSLGDYGEAARLFKRSLDAHAALPRTAASLNNTAVVAGQLFAVSGERRYFEQALSLLDEASALNPADGILLYNVMHQQLAAGTMDTVGDALDQHALHESGHFGLLGYLYRDHEGRVAVARKLAEHPRVIAALAKAEKLFVIRPKESGTYELASRVHVLTGDATALRALRDRLAHVELDLSADADGLRKYRAGEMDKQYRDSLAAREKQLDAVVARGKAGSKGSTYGVAAAQLADARLSRFSLGDTPDPDDCVRLAEIAWREAPSSGTRQTLVGALTFRAMARLAAKDAELGKLLDAQRRYLSPYRIVAVAMETSGPRRAAMASDADFKRAAALAAEQCAELPEECEASDWAVVGAVDPAAGTRVAEAIRKDAVRALQAETAVALNPLDSTAALEAYWLQRIGGNEAAARDVLKAAAKRGVPLPEGLGAGG